MRKRFCMPCHGSRAASSMGQVPLAEVIWKELPVADASAPDAVPAARVAGALEVRVPRGRLQLLQLPAKLIGGPSAAMTCCL